MGYFIASTCGLAICGLGVLLDLLLARRREVRRVAAEKAVEDRWWRQKVLEEQRIEAARSKKMMEDLVEMPGWQFIAEAAKMQALSRRNEVMLKPTENPLAQEYLKGEVQGIELFVSLPEKLIESSKAIIDLANSEVD